MLTEDQVAALNDQACTNNLGRQGEWGELNEDGKAWAIELARLAYERGRAETATAGDEQDHQAWLVLMMTRPEKAALAAHALRQDLAAATAKLEAAEAQVTELTRRCEKEAEWRLQTVAAHAQLTDELRAELADVAYIDRAGSLLGTRLDSVGGIPAELPGIDEDHIHFVMMPIGAVSRRAAVEWLRANGALCAHDDNPRSCRECASVDAPAAARMLCDGCGCSKERCDAFEPPAIKCCPDCRHVVDLGPGREETKP